jgi:hypothetical protein
VIFPHSAHYGKRHRLLLLIPVNIGLPGFGGRYYYSPQIMSIGFTKMLGRVKCNKNGKYIKKRKI